MKKLTFIIIAVLLSIATSAQTLFSVPEVTDLQKLQIAKGLCYNNILMGISYAKSQGITVEEYAKYGGEQIKPFYKELGFESFVRDQLNAWVAMVGNTEIMSQSENKIIFRISQVYPALETQGPFWNVSYAEMMKWLELIYAIPCESIGLSYSMKITDQGAEITIEKK